MTGNIATNAASSGIVFDRKKLKALAKRSDRPGLIWLAQWVVLLTVTGWIVYLTLGSWWLLPAMMVYGTVLTVPAYALSHECAHGTAFRTRWLNEACLWLGSLIYFEEPHHRRYSHTRHHTYTWHVGKDSQMPFDTPMTFRGWLLETTGIALFSYEIRVFALNALGRFSDETRTFTPVSELPKLKWGARACLAVYALLTALVASGSVWPLYFILLPRLLGGPVMLLFTLIQHVELQENSPSILESTRSFRTGCIGRFLYMNMNNHVEHHLYPLVPFHGLPALSKAIADQLPEPDPGFFRTNWEVFQVVLHRSLGRSTKAPSLRQAPNMITAGGFDRLSKASMS
ncbi:fatty acid desaturase [Pelagibius sp. Alg239-R121]|uniref:fatty acid desaturase n=1 Tax=Pelagibius sp. Alg239-R121 TaxID=2993448 RepID=UPI0024A6E3E9|nr:fatty acid desaturase [Pelagibius sp. Alg239-R121]